MTNILPVRLGAEPLIDVIFEIRFTALSAVTDILPGFIYSAFGKSTKIEQLDISDLPRVMRDNDPNLKFAPLKRVITDEAVIGIGDRVLVIASKIPYPGWSKFKDIIFKVLSVVIQAEVVDTVQRYSLKYVDFIEAYSIEDQIKMISAEISIGKRKLVNQSFNFRMEVPENNIHHLLTIASSANIKNDNGGVLSGIVIDVDSIVNAGSVNFKGWCDEEFDSHLEDLHLKNKELFFECISEEALIKLEPEYE